MKMTTEIINLNHVVGKDRTQAMVEADIIVPDTKPDVVKILQVEAKAIVRSSEILQDKVSSDIEVKFEILYIGEDKAEPIYAIIAKEKTSQELSILGAKPEMKSRCSCHIEHADCKILNPRKLNVKAVIEIEGIVEKDEKIPVVTDCSENSTVHTLKQKINLNAGIGSIDVPIIVRDDMDIPAGKPFAKNIVKINTNVLDKNVRLSQDKAECRGTLKINVVYISDSPESSIEFIEQEIPFSEVIDMPGVTEGMDNLMTLMVEEADGNIKEDEDGDKSIIPIEACIRAKVSAYNTLEKEIVVDAYSTSEVLNMEKRVINLSNYVGENHMQSGVKDTLTLDSEMPPIKQVLSVKAVPVVAESLVDNGKVGIEGIIELNMLYLSNDEEKPIQNVYKEIPVRQEVEVVGAEATGSMRAEAGLEVEHISYNIIADDEVELRIVMMAYSIVYDFYKKQLIVDISETGEKHEGKDAMSSIIVYVVQKDDNLWDIAKRYYVTVEQLIAVNKIENPDNLMVGQKIYIIKTVKL